MHLQRVSSYVVPLPVMKSGQAWQHVTRLQRHHLCFRAMILQALQQRDPAAHSEASL